MENPFRLLGVKHGLIFWLGLGLSPQAVPAFLDEGVCLLYGKPVGMDDAAAQPLGELLAHKGMYDLEPLQYLFTEWH